MPQDLSYCYLSIVLSIESGAAAEVLRQIMTLLTTIPHVLYIIIISLINYNNISQGVFAFTSSYPCNRCTFPKIANEQSVLQLRSSNSNNIDDNYNNVNVAGVSVSPNGFLVILQSILLHSSQQKQIAFPIALTTPPPTSTTSGNNTKSNLELPSLFQENYDQLSVTTPESLTFLQLLNGVDMASPCLVLFYIM